MFSLKYKGPEKNTVGDKLELGTRFDLNLKISDIGINFWISLASKRHCRYIILQGGRCCAGAEKFGFENFKPDHTLFCHELRGVAIYALFEDLWAKKVPIWVQNSVSWARSALMHGIYCILH